MTAVAEYLLELARSGRPGRPHVGIVSADDGQPGWRVVIELGIECDTYAEALRWQRAQHDALVTALETDLAQLHVLQGDGDPFSPDWDTAT